MEKHRYEMKSEVWLYPGMAGWHFISIPKKEGAEIKARFGGKARGWGSLPVLATIGKTSWRTSIFPDKASGSYLMPLKAEIRKKEGVMKGEVVRFGIVVKP